LVFIYVVNTTTCKHINICVNVSTNYYVNYINMSLVHEIKDFRGSTMFRQAKLETQNVKGINDEAVTCFALHDAFDVTEHAYFATLKDIHAFSGTETIQVPVGLGNLSKYDGIYDIWLRNCQNVQTISVCFDNVEIPITRFEKTKDESVQIPLTFSTDGNPVGHVYLHRETGWYNRRLSFIPSIAIQFDRMFIKLNPGASCDVVISTIYFQRYFRREIVHSSNTFFVNGVKLLAQNGTVQEYDASKKKSCIIC
jgi:hypothetical protein